MNTLTADAATTLFSTTRVSAAPFSVTRFNANGANAADDANGANDVSGEGNASAARMKAAARVRDFMLLFMAFRVALIVVLAVALLQTR